MLMSKELIHDPTCKTSFLTDIEYIIQNTHQIFTNITTGMNMNLVCTTETSKSRGKFKYPTLKQANVTKVNEDEFATFIRACMHAMDECVDLVNMIGLKRFATISLHKAFKITDRRELCNNLVEI